MWSYLKGTVKEESVLLAAFPVVKKEQINQEIEQYWDAIWTIRELVNKKIEEQRVAKTIGHSLDTKVTIEAPEKEYGLLEKLGDDLKDVFIVSQMALKKGNEMNITVEKAEGEKCERCWQYATDIKKEGKFPNVCSRCENTLSSL